MTRKECLEKAIEAACSDRENIHGTPEDNFGLISDLWTIYLGVKIKPKDVAMMMCLLKIARIKTGRNKDDSFVDIAGYAACGCEICGEVKPLRNE